MFSAYKKFDNRENILRKSSEVVVMESKPKEPVAPVASTPEQISPDSITKVTYASVLKFGQGQEAKNDNQCNEFNLFQKGMASDKKESPSPNKAQRTTHGLSNMRSTADFGL